MAARELTTACILGSKKRSVLLGLVHRQFGSLQGLDSVLMLLAEQGDADGGGAGSLGTVELIGLLERMQDLVPHRLSLHGRFQRVLVELLLNMVFCGLACGDAWVLLAMSVLLWPSWGPDDSPQRLMPNLAVLSMMTDN